MRRYSFRCTMLAGPGANCQRGQSGENEEGAVCIGAAIANRAGEPVAALSVSAPETRMAPARIAEVGRELAEAARRVSELVA